MAKQERVTCNFCGAQVDKKKIEEHKLYHCNKNPNKQEKPKKEKKNKYL